MAVDGSSVMISINFKNLQQRPALNTLTRNFPGNFYHA